MNSNYEFIEADILMNGRNKNWDLTGVRNNSTHEIGHTIGMGDLPAWGPETMSTSCSDDPSSLHDDDKIGVSFLYGGNLIDDENFTGQLYFKWPIIVTSGCTMTVSSSPGTTVEFQNGASLSINGSLTASGSSTYPITFRFQSPNSTTQNGIKFYPGSSGNLSYCFIRNAYRGIYSQSITPSISNCVFYGNTTGIYFNNTGASTTQITNNRFENNIYCGIYLYSSSPHICYNQIINNGTYGIYCYSSSNPKLYGNNPISGHLYGIYCSQSSSPYLAEPTGPYYGHGHNVIRANGIGIFTDYYSSPYLGIGVYGGHNCVHGNADYEISANYGCSILAENNWWYHQTNPYYTSSDFNIYQSSIDYIPSLSSDPNGCSLPKLALSETVLDPGEQDFFDSTTISALELQLGGKIEYAMNIYKKIFDNEQFNAKGKYALNKIRECSETLDRVNEFLEYTQAIGNKISKTDEFYAYLFEMENNSLLTIQNYDKILVNLSKILNNFKQNAQIYKNALFSLGCLYYNSINNHQKAREFFDLLAQNYPNDFLTYDSKYILGEDGERSSLKSIESIKSSSHLDHGGNFLGENYPNPFNPTTTITYQLPKAGNVSIKVYDMLGKEIASLVDEYKTEGRYSVEFNAQKLSSGMYIYEMKVTSGESSFNSIKKMMFLK